MTKCLNFDILDITRLKRDSVNISTHCKECHVISCRITGESLFSFDEKEIIASVGDVLYIPKGATYKQRTEGEEVIFIHLEVFGSAQEKIQIVNADNPEKICQIFCKIESLWKQKSKNSSYRCMSILYDLIAETSIALPDQTASKSLLDPALAYINNHFTSADFSVEAASKKCNISRVHFNRLFKKEMKMPPTEYVNRLRISTAEFLLKSEDYTNDEIATLCGFNDTKYFYVVFKKITGMTTKEYKSH